MVFFKTLHSPRLLKHLTHSNYSPYFIHNHFRFSSAPHFISPISFHFPIFTSLIHQPFSHLSQPPAEQENTDQTLKSNQKPLHLLFQEAVGLSEKIETSESESENEKELNRNLKKLEKEVRKLNEKAKEKKNLDVESCKDDKFEKKQSLSELFRNEKKAKKYYVKKDVTVEVKRREAPVVFKKLSEDMEMFVTYLYKEGYFRDANFLPGKGFDLSCFDDSYGRDFIKYAAEKFGKDHQEIAKWLSGSDLKSVALFGCPTQTKKNIFAAKRLRTFFEIQENTVCSKCVLKDSCKFPNQSVWKGDSKNLKLDDVMRVITLYALEAIDPQLVLPEELNSSVSRLLKEVINLSKTSS